MQRRLLVLVAASALAAGGAVLAQTHQGPGHGSPQQDRPGMMMQQPGGGGQAAGPGDRPAGMMMDHGGGMMGGGMGDRRGGGPGHMGPGMLTMMMAMMDTNADRALSLEEFQAVHGRMFKYADADNDGKLTIQELRKFHIGDVDPDQD